MNRKKTKDKGNETTDEQRIEVLKPTRLRDDAYAVALKAGQTNEFVYPFVPQATLYVAPVEQKYCQLTPEEISAFYLRESADPFLYPKETNFYIAILKITNSIDLISTAVRNEDEWAYSKVFIKRALTPDQWNGDLFKLHDLPKVKPMERSYKFNYFDYIKAWEGAFCYENSRKKHTWFFQFRDFDTTKIPQWFVEWFHTWGANPIIFPDKIRGVYEEFEKTNSCVKNPELIFVAHYKVPWIMKWDVVLANMPVNKFGKNVAEIPYLGRRILIRWWEKFDFFKDDSVFSQRGLLSFRSSPPPQLLSLPPQLLSLSSSKETIKRKYDGTEDDHQEAKSQKKQII